MDPSRTSHKEARGEPRYKSPMTLSQVPPRDQGSVTRTTLSKMPQNLCTLAIWVICRNLAGHRNTNKCASTQQTKASAWLEPTEQGSTSHTFGLVLDPSTPHPKPNAHMGRWSRRPSRPPPPAPRRGCTGRRARGPPTGGCHTVAGAGSAGVRRDPGGGGGWDLGQCGQLLVEYSMTVASATVMAALSDER